MKILGLTSLKFCIAHNLRQAKGSIKGKNKQSFVEAKRLSYGTLRCLAIISALLSKESGSIVLIEEVDNGIHPNRVQGLISAISEIARDKENDVVITTHNPALLNAICREDLEGVVVCYRDNESGSSEFVQILDIDNKKIADFFDKSLVPFPWAFSVSMHLIMKLFRMQSNYTTGIF